MRWGKKHEYYKRITKTRFAILPMRRMGEWRWLEWVTYSGYYWRGVSGTLYWENEGGWL